MFVGDNYDSSKKLVISTRDSPQHKKTGKSTPLRLRFQVPQHSNYVEQVLNTILNGLMKT